LRAVQAFVDANKDRLGGLAESGVRRRLDKVIAAAFEHASKQVDSSQWSKAATAEVRAIRAALVRDYLTPSRVIGVLDALITSTLNDAPDLLARWNQVKKIRK
jgi:hypothetical protein